MNNDFNIDTKKGLAWFLSAFGVAIIILAFVGGVILCINTKNSITYGTYYSYTRDEWQPIGLLWMALTWISGVFTGSVLLWMSEMLTGQRLQSAYLEKLVTHPNDKENAKPQVPTRMNEPSKTSVHIARNYKVGDAVHHAVYGNGTIKELTGNYAVVEFYNGQIISIEINTENMNKA